MKPELPKAPVQPNWRVKDEAIKAEHEKKYNAEYEKWLERKKYYDETEYPAYKAERLRRAAASLARKPMRWCSLHLDFAEESRDHADRRG